VIRSGLPPSRPDRVLAPKLYTPNLVEGEFSEGRYLQAAPKSNGEDNP
jgi:hypothetical protein